MRCAGGRRAAIARVAGHSRSSPYPLVRLVDLDGRKNRKCAIHRCLPIQTIDGDFGYVSTGWAAFGPPDDGFNCLRFAIDERHYLEAPEGGQQGQSGDRSDRTLCGADAVGGTSRIAIGLAPRQIDQIARTSLCGPLISKDWVH